MDKRVVYHFPFTENLGKYGEFPSVTQSVQLFLTPWIAACQASLCITNSWSQLKPKLIESVMPSKHFILCLCPPQPSIFLSTFSSESHGLFQRAVLHIEWPKHSSSSFSISPPNQYSGLISYRIDCFDLLAVQMTLKCFL